MSDRSLNHLDALLGRMTTFAKAQPLGVTALVLWPFLFGGLLFPWSEGVSLACGFLAPVAFLIAVEEDMPLLLIWGASFLGFHLCIYWLGETIERFFDGAALAAFATHAILLVESLCFVFIAKGMRWLRERNPSPAAKIGGAMVGALVLDLFWPRMIPTGWGSNAAGFPVLNRSTAFIGGYGIAAAQWGGGAAVACAIGRTFWAPRGHRLREGVESLDLVATGLAVALGPMLIGSALWLALPRGEAHALDVLFLQPNFSLRTHVPNRVTALWAQSNAALAAADLPRADRTALVLWPESSLVGSYDSMDPTRPLLDPGAKVVWAAGGVAFPMEGSPATGQFNYTFTRFEAPGSNPHVVVRHDLFPWVESVPGPTWFRRRVGRWFPQLEGYEPGSLGKDSAFTFQTVSGPVRLNSVMCSEALSPLRVTRGVSEAGGDLLVNPSNDYWLGDTEGTTYAMRASALRAVECGVPLLRPTQTGRSGVAREDGTWTTWGGKLQAGKFLYPMTWRVIATPWRHLWYARAWIALLFLTGGCLAAWPWLWRRLRPALS